MRRFAIASLLVSMLSMSVARAEEPTPTSAVADEELYRCKSATPEVVMSFKPEMEIKDLVTWAIGFTCKPFMLAPNIVSTGRKVTLVAPTKMSRSEAYAMFLAALSTAGLTVVPKGKGYRIVEAATARTQTLPIYTKKLPDDTDQVVRYVHRPTYAKPETLQKAFQAVRSEAGDVQLVGSLVLVTDYGSSVREMMQLAKLIDVPEGTDAIYTLPVRHADATKLGAKLETILGLGKDAPKAAPDAPDKGGGGATPAKLLVDERTNTLLVVGTEAAFSRVQALVERLDISMEMEAGASIHVYKLAHGLAPDLATVLTSVIQGSAKTDAKAAAPGAAPLGDGETRVTGEVRVTADPTSNSLVVLASGRDYFAIKEIIKQLDEPRRQVYIEGMIVEVSLTNDLDLGVTAHGVIPGTSMLLGNLNTAGTNGASSLSPEKTIPTSSGIVTGVLSSATTTIMGTTIPSYGALLTAVATKTNSNIMSLPSIIAVDNQLTHLSIGTSIAYLRGTTLTGVGGTIPQNNYDRENLDLKLDIKPHISPDETVLLEIDHSAKDLGENTAYGPTWNTRELKGQVVVRDQQTVVIGGLISTKEYVSKTQIPILGDIPVLGTLFRSTKKQKRKANMVILLTPYIVRDQADIEAIRSRRMRQTDEFVKSFSTLDGMKYRPRIDYQRKRGLIEEINRAVQTVEEDDAALKALRAVETMKQGAI